MSQELTLTACADDWWHVEQNDDHVEYVETVKIAGCEIEPRFPSYMFTVVCSNWSITRDLFPALLIEAAEWYDRPEEEQ